MSPAPAKPDLTADRAAALRLTPVSRETLARLDRFVELLLRWTNTTNLVSPRTVPRLWTRHVADSLQLVDLSPTARTWIDLGSGAGFPGLVIACALADQPGVKIHLIESNAKKAAFLREATRLTGAPAIVHAERIERFAESFWEHADVITARALTPLNLLFDQSLGLWTSGTLGLFPKGQDVEAELTEAAKYWTIKVNLVPSRTDSKGRIVVVHAVERRK